MEKTKAVILTKNLIPYPTTFGTAIQAWSFAKTLIETNYEVHLCCFAFDTNKGKMAWDQHGIQPVMNLLEANQIHLHLIGHKEREEENQNYEVQGKWKNLSGLIRNSVFPDLDKFFEVDLYQEDVSNLLKEISPDFVCAWSDYAVNVITPDLPYPIIAVTTDLIDLARKSRREMNPVSGFRARFLQFLANMGDRKLSQRTIDQLNRCTLVFNHAHHHAEWLRNKGVGNVSYHPIPVLDYAGEDWAKKKQLSQSENQAFRIMMAGNITGVATLSGLYFLSDELIPQLEKQLPIDQIEIHIVGGGELRDDLASLQQKPYIKLRGYVEDIYREYQSCDVFLVPTTIELGFRTRIAEAFSFGCCTVAHTSNHLGMLEINDGENCLLASTGEEMAKKIKRCFDSPALRQRLSVNARETYENELDGSTVCNKMIDEIEEVLSSR